MSAGHEPLSQVPAISYFTSEEVNVQSGYMTSTGPHGCSEEPGLEPMCHHALSRCLCYVMLQVSSLRRKVCGQVHETNVNLFVNPLVKPFS